MATIRRLSDSAVLTVRDNPVWLAGIWECGDQRFTDHSQTLYAANGGNPVIAVGFPSVSKADFYLLFTAAEEIAIRASTDPVVEVFLRRIDNLNPGGSVDMTLGSVSEAVEYLSVTSMTPLATPPGPPYVAPSRVAHIMAGELQ